MALRRPPGAAAQELRRTPVSTARVLRGASCAPAACGTRRMGGRAIEKGRSGTRRDLALEGEDVSEERNMAIEQEQTIFLGSSNGAIDF